jgi:hypothetical protein
MEATNKEETNKNLSGIGGWLLLPALVLIISPLRMAFQFYTDILPALAPRVWDAVTNPVSANYHPLWGPLIAFEAGSGILMLMYTLVLAWFFFTKSKRVPKLFILWFVLNAAIQILDSILAAQIPAVAALPDTQSQRDLIRAIIAAAIWIPYFLKSERVKNTFV